MAAIAAAEHSQLEQRFPRTSTLLAGWLDLQRGGSGRGRVAQYQNSLRMAHFQSGCSELVRGNWAGPSYVSFSPPSPTIALLTDDGNDREPWAEQ